MFCPRNLIAVGVLLLALALPVGKTLAWAQESHQSSEAGRADVTLGASGGVGTGRPPAGAQWVEVASYEQLREYLTSSSYWGKELAMRLVCDITVEPGDSLSVTSMPRFPTQYLDAGDFTITVQGNLTLPYQLSITGQGGEEGIFRVARGGYLCLFGSEIEVKEGYAVWQEEGGIFAYYDAGRPMPPAEQLHLAPALAWPDSARYGWENQPVVVLREGDSPADLLPKTDLATVFANGVYSETSTALAVAWDVQQAAEQFAAKRRFVLTGQYAGLQAFAPPTCLIVFMEDRPAAFTRLRVADSEGYIQVEGFFELAAPQGECRLEYSTDGENWGACSPMVWRQEGNTVYFVQEFEEVSFPLYLSIAVGEEGAARYSNVLALVEGGSFTDVGGNRGGGTDLDNGGELPPIIELPAQEPDSQDNPGSTDEGNGGPSGSQNALEPAEKDQPAIPVIAQEEGDRQPPGSGTPHEGTGLIPDAGDSPPASDGSVQGEEPAQLPAAGWAVWQMALGGCLLAAVLGTAAGWPWLARLAKRLYGSLK